MTSSHESVADSPPTNVGAIVAAAGQSRRMGGMDKIFAPLMGRPLVSFSLQALQDSPHVDTIILVLPAENVSRGKLLVSENGWDKVREVLPGGERRQDSVRLGLDRLPDLSWIIVHDGARPFIDDAIITRGLAEARQTGAAVAAVPVKDTIKTVDTDMFVDETLRRERLWTVQTPQVFRRDVLAAAYDRCSGEVTDDAALVERAGGRVRIFPGSYRNIKVTTPDDMLIAETMLRSQLSSASQDGL